MTTRINHQFATFFFVLGEQVYVEDIASPDQEAVQEQLYALWKKAIKLIEARQAEHPMYRYQERHGQDLLDFTRWEYCDQDGATAVHEGLLAWPVAFYSDKAFPSEVLRALRDLCQDCFDAAGKEAGVAVRLSRIETSTEYISTETKVLEEL